MKTLRFALAFTLSLFLSGQAFAHEMQRIRLATTTSTDNSGLLAVLHPVFEEKNHIKVDVIAVGTGKALRLGTNGDVDVVMVHAPGAEKKFIAEGSGVERLPVMHNDFVLLGPAEDPADVKDAASLDEALQRIVTSNATFVSRGDDSGTHKKEKALWKSAGIEPQGSWYQAAGQGMGAVLQMSNNKQAYTLSDRGTYLAFKDKLSLAVVYEGAPNLLNPYHVILVNPEKHPHVKTELAQRYVDFIRSPEGQRIIADFKVNGEALFKPDVVK
ncbi:MAG: substrate-binding domain-containing protein [Pseudomonadales bacterium]|jgi:tungstate transport system substrate-binding protein